MRVSAVESAGRIHILPRNYKHRVTVRKSDLVNSKSQAPLRPRNKALLSLDGGGLRGILTGATKLPDVAVRFVETADQLRQAILHSVNTHQ